VYDQLYRDSQHRIIELVTPLSAGELARITPACPLWSVQDVLAHLAGACAAFGAPADADGTAPAPATPAWTQAQVVERRGRTVAELAAEWHRCTPAVTALPLESRSWLPVLHDVLSHEADLRGTIGAPQLPAGVLAAAWPLVQVPIQRRLARFGSVLLDLDGRRTVLGDGAPELVVEAGQFNFWRGLFGRRSRAQLAGWVRHEDAAGFAEALPIFPARDDDLTETC
jgi:uncharacterized protein (TIGR03083 family)